MMNKNQHTGAGRPASGKKPVRHAAPGAASSSGSRLLPAVVISGAVVSAVTVMVSLLAYFQPVVLTNPADWKAVAWVREMISEKKQAAKAAGTDAQAHGESEGGEGGTAGNGGQNAGGGESASLSPGEVQPIELGELSDLDMESFPTEEGTMYSAVLDTSMGPMVYYSQGDVRWADYLYGGADPMKKYGCGPSATAMLISSFSPQGADVTPIEAADWSAANGYYAAQGGSYHGLIPQSLAAYGLKVESVQDRSPAHVQELLQTGHVLVALMGKGALTNNGHFILITRSLEDGYVSIADPNRYENCKKSWDLNALLAELKRSYDSGGPLWAVSAGE